jgi:hypothetical protein
LCSSECAKGNESYLIKSLAVRGDQMVAEAEPMAGKGAPLTPDVQPHMDWLFQDAGAILSLGPDVPGYLLAERGWSRRVDRLVSCSLNNVLVRSVSRFRLARFLFLPLSFFGSFRWTIRCTRS